MHYLGLALLSLWSLSLRSIPPLRDADISRHHLRFPRYQPRVARAPQADSQVRCNCSPTMHYPLRLLGRSCEQKRSLVHPGGGRRREMGAEERAGAHER